MSPEWPPSSSGQRSRPLPRGRAGGGVRTTARRRPHVREPVAGVGDLRPPAVAAEGSGQERVRLPPTAPGPGRGARQSSDPSRAGDRRPTLWSSPRRPMEKEQIMTTAPSAGRPVVFIHGLWLQASSWQPWVDSFRAAGDAAGAPGWPGERATVAQTREDPDLAAGHGIQEVTEHYAGIIAGLDQPPVLIGHSFGGMIAEKLLGEGHGAGAVAIDAAQIKGVLPLPLSSLHATLPVFKNPANRHRSVSLSADEFRYAFGNAVSQEESDQLYDAWNVPSPGRPLFEAAAANFSLHASTKVNTDNSSRGPLLLMMGGQ